MARLYSRDPKIFEAGTGKANTRFSNFVEVELEVSRLMIPLDGLSSAEPTGIAPNRVLTAGTPNAALLLLQCVQEPDAHR